ncbi:MAG TPA: 23S rRNA (pseudouridine(1915)-N(3))-methyltransferase RlmH [Alphaproteobacteria bacterium]|nr:23S rRNA (pseudouridine(1915)-N(3))-methyltransferase RlmH [Rhodospirillaceae bacterium]HRJ11948.1 23S rRNA (pseudouridine(1915)-N(3))-methyltransferase RlmH [Alphaproteobacteria bacterium]
MAKIRTLVAAVGKMSGQKFHAPAAEYQRRMPHVQVTEIDIRKKLPPLEMQKAEGDELLRASLGFHRIVLDVGGKSYSSESFAEALQSWHDRHGQVAFLIGSADGHGAAVRAAADQSLSLGSFTLPHLLARVVLLEQLYRAETILTKHPYHRG